MATDRDNTPQGKLARGTIFAFWVGVGFVALIAAAQIIEQAIRSYWL